VNERTGRQWLDYDNPYSVGMTGLLGAYSALHEADLLLMLETDFPFTEFLPGDKVTKVQIDREPGHIGRRTHVDLGLVGESNRPWLPYCQRFAREAMGIFLRSMLSRQATLKS